MNLNLTASGNIIQDAQAAINSDLENLRKWLIGNKLSLNVAKTEFMLISSKQMLKKILDPHPSIFIENKLNKSMNAKLLEKQLTSIYSAKVIVTIFAKQYVQEFLLFVESNLMLTKKHLFLYIILLFALSLTIAISIGRVITQSK